jgi:hypothetical protein
LVVWACAAKGAATTNAPRTVTAMICPYRIGASSLKAVGVYHRHPHDADQFLTSAVWTDAKRLSGEYLVDLGPMDGPDRADWSWGEKEGGGRPRCQWR